MHTIHNVKRHLVNLLSDAERRLFTRLSSPRRIQDYLDSLPINFELRGETYMSPRRLIKKRTAHCFEGALLAAAAMYCHGGKPLLLDLQTIGDDEDHVVAPFFDGGYWGAISKTNHSILRYRDPVYKTVRELSMSYFHEYITDGGKKSMRSFSKPFDLSIYAPEKWMVAEDDLYWLVEALDSSPHFPIAPKKTMKKLRKAAAVEIQASKMLEWRKGGQLFGK